MERSIRIHGVRRRLRIERIIILFLQRELQRGRRRYG